MPKYPLWPDDHSTSTLDPGNKQVYHKYICTRWCVSYPDWCMLLIIIWRAVVYRLCIGSCWNGIWHVRLRPTHLFPVKQPCPPNPIWKSPVLGKYHSYLRFLQQQLIWMCPVQKKSASGCLSFSQGSSRSTGDSCSSSEATQHGTPASFLLPAPLQGHGAGGTVLLPLPQQWRLLPPHLYEIIPLNGRCITKTLTPLSLPLFLGKRRAWSTTELVVTRACAVAHQTMCCFSQGRRSELFTCVCCGKPFTLVG